MFNNCVFILPAGENPPAQRFLIKLYTTQDSQD